MSDNPELHTYEQTLAGIRTDRASALRTPRTSPWYMGLSAALATAVPFVVGLVVYLAVEQWLDGEWRQAAALLAVGMALPIPVFVWWLVIDTLRLEHARLVAAKATFEADAKLPAPPAPAEPPAPDEHLRPGYLSNGQVVARVPQPSAEKVFLKNACLKHMQLGMATGKWSRSALAEGDDAPMTGTEWDASSPELQRLGYLWNKPGKNGGLQPVPGKAPAEVIKLLEVAQ